MLMFELIDVGVMPPAPVVSPMTPCESAGVTLEVRLDLGHALCCRSSGADVLPGGTNPRVRIRPAGQYAPVLGTQRLFPFCSDVVAHRSRQGVGLHG